MLKFFTLPTTPTIAVPFASSRPTQSPPDGIPAGLGSGELSPG